jgi:hypothetical protein
MSEERWGVWCEHADGRKYWLGDSTLTKWSKVDAERIAAYLAPEEGLHEAHPLPAYPKFLRSESQRLDSAELKLEELKSAMRVNHYSYCKNPRIH